jgi:uncharacterized protein (DUF1501 family)
MERPMLSRRDFLQRSSLVSLSPIVPLALSRVAAAAPAQPDANVLVVIQLDGGNDGINTVVPFGDDAYGRNRVSLRLDAAALHKLNDHVGIHPQMRAAKELYDDGRLTIVQGVGYPNPDRSHFRSMRIWQTARFDDAELDGYGWLGRALDERQLKQHASEQPSAIFAGSEAVPIALWGRRAEAMSLTSLDELKLPFATGPLTASANSTAPAKAAPDGLSLFVTRQVLSAYTSAEQFARQASAHGGMPSSEYPASQLGANLKLIAQLMKRDAPARVYYTVQGGYDTHAAQLYTHAQLLREFSDGLKAFLDDLKHDGLQDRVLVLAFSEFGRRVKENDSHGTDHGAAGPVFVAGGRSVGGLVGATPDLTDLDDGDLKMGIDMREVYATLLDDWLGVNATSVLGESFPQLRILRAS